MRTPLRNKPLFLSGLSILFTVASLEEYLGPQFSAAQLKNASAPLPAVAAATSTDADSIAHWNQIAIDASGLDHLPVAAGDPRVFGEQLGPARASRAMAIVHIAMFDSVNGIVGSYKSYTNITPAKNASMATAIGQAARDTLTALFPSQQATGPDQSKPGRSGRLLESGHSIRYAIGHPISGAGASVVEQLGIRSRL